jgi:hypothetical protein
MNRPRENERKEIRCRQRKTGLSMNVVSKLQLTRQRKMNPTPMISNHQSWMLSRTVAKRQRCPEESKKTRQAGGQRNPVETARTKTRNKTLLET